MSIAGTSEWVPVTLTSRDCIYATLKAAAGFVASRFSGKQIEELGYQFDFSIEQVLKNRKDQGFDVDQTVIVVQPPDGQGLVILFANQECK